MANLNEIRTGWDVYSNEGDKVGSVDDVTSTYFIVRKGLLMPKDYYVPQDGILKVDAAQGRVFVNCTKGQLESMGWDQPYDESAGTGADEYGTLTNTTRDTEFAEGGAQGSQRIPRYEEELRAEKASRQTGEVQVSKSVTEEREDFEVPVTREDVQVRRVAVNRPAGETEQAFQEGDTIRVPVRSEQVQLTKEPRVVEEIEIQRTSHQETQRVGDTVRREQVNVNRQGDVEARQGDLVGAGADRTQATDLGDGSLAATHPTDVDEFPDEDSDKGDERSNTAW